MMIADVVFLAGHGGYFNLDLAALKQGREKDGFIYSGGPMTAGYKSVAQPGVCLTVMIVFDDGQIGIGEGTSVIFAGAAGRDPLLDPAVAVEILQREVRPCLLGKDLSSARALSAEIETMELGGKPLNRAIRYGLSQAVYNAVALRRRQSIAEVICDEFGTTIAKAPIPLLGGSEQDDTVLIDRMILKRADMLPHGAFSSVEHHLGRDGSKLLAYVAGLAARIRQFGDTDYLPGIHIDMYGSIGELFADGDQAAAYIDKVAAAAAPYPLWVETPVLETDRDAHFARFRHLKMALAKRNSPARIIMDDWCNTLEDIEECVRMSAADCIQIKTPDLGGVNAIVEAVIECKRAGMGTCLGGSINETDLAARTTAQIALACQPDFMMAKPGLGFDEAFMIQRNEMLRTLTLIDRKAQLSQGQAGSVDRM